MQQFDVKGGIDVTAKIKAQMDESPIANPPLAGMDGEGMQSFMEAANSSADSLKENSALLKEFGNIMPEIVKNLRYMNQLVANTNRNLPALGKGGDGKDKSDKDDKRNNFGLVGFLNSGSGMAQSVANGNVIGATTGGLKTIANAADMAEKMPGLAGIAKGIGAFGGIALAGAAVLAGANAYADKFFEAAPTVYGTGKAFGAKTDGRAISAYEQLNTYNRGTGLDTDSFNSLAQSIRKQGIANGLDTSAQIDIVGDIAKTTSRWAYATNGDADRYAELAGLMGRYGKSNNISGDFNYLVSAGKASGLNDTQIPEFLDGIKKVMEEGVAKGFETSATEVADTLLMFSKMSGGDKFWQGEQGAKMLNRANAGIAGATALSKTEDILVYAAMEKAYSEGDKKRILGQSYVEGSEYANTMQMIERGIRGDNYNAIMGYITSSYGSKDEQIEALRNMTGLNYNGAARLLNLGNGATDTKIKEIFTAPENQTKENRYQESVNKLKETVVKIGEVMATGKTVLTERIAKDVNSIANHLIGNRGAKEEAQEVRNSLSSRQAWAAQANKALFNSGDWEKNRDNLNKLAAIGDLDRMPAEYSLAFEAYSQKTRYGVLPNYKIKGNFDSDNMEQMDDYLRSGFGARLKYLAGENDPLSDNAVEQFLSNLYNNPVYMDRLKEKTQQANADQWVTSSERDDIFNELKSIFSDLRKNGILVTSSR